MGIITQDVGTRFSINVLDLKNVLFDQIIARNVVLGIPGGPIIVGHLIVVGLFYYLLELELFKAVESNVTRAIFVIATMVLVLESKAHTHNNFLRPKRKIDAGIPGSTLHSVGLVDGRHKYLNALLV